MPAAAYGARQLREFAGVEHEEFIANGGRPLRPRLARSLALADLRPGLAIVDIGCGRGEAVVHAARRGASVTAIDFSPDALALARATAESVLCEERRVRLKFLHSDATAIPLQGGSVDRVLLLDLAEHLTRRQLQLALVEARRILRPGGYVVVHTLPNRWAVELAYPMLRLLAPELPAEPRTGYERAVHINEQDPLSLRRNLSAAGFESRTWVEEWTTRHARFASGRSYTDRVRSSAYPVLRRPWASRLSRLLMATPARWLVGNDVFALAWPIGSSAPPRRGRFAPLR